MKRTIAELADMVISRMVDAILIVLAPVLSFKCHCLRSPRSVLDPE